MTKFFYYYISQCEKGLFSFQIKRKNFEACIETDFFSTFRIQINANLRHPLNFNIPFVVNC